MNPNLQHFLKKIPSVDKCLQHADIKPFLEGLPRAFVVDCIRKVQNDYREKIKTLKQDISSDWDESSFFNEVRQQLIVRQQGYLRKVINATGIIVHTNLGRSIFSEAVADRVKRIMTTYNNLEYDLEAGQRSSRYEHLVPLLRKLTGYEDSLIVNNNAAAVLLMLDTFAKDKDVIISRSELVEIGGGFRVPEVMKKAGARLVEVGCTNKTYIEDYDKAITPETAMILKVHRSNFHITGFTAEPSIRELSELAKKRKLIFMFDLGSGNLLRDESLLRINEPSVTSCFQNEIDVVTFSGDKLLGGPQAGIILAHSSIINDLKNNQLLRALRVDKMCLAGLEAALEYYFRDFDELAEGIPTLGMLSESAETIKNRAEKMVRTFTNTIGDQTIFSIEQGFSQLGGGGLPHEQFPTFLISIEHKTLSTSDIEVSLRSQIPPVITRIANNKVLIDLRTVPENDEQPLIQGIINTLS